MSGTEPAEISVRMYRALETLDPKAQTYRGLLGDCFLIRLAAGGKRSNILIDCGMLLGSPNAAGRMQEIADDIVTTCPDGLDLLVVTHEHWDHISGFSQAWETFSKKLKVHAVWMAWTEKPGDQDAEELRQRFGGSGNDDRSAVSAQEVRQRFDTTGAALAMMGPRVAAQRESLGVADETALEGLAGFLGPIGDEEPAGDPDALGAAAAPVRRLKGREIMAAVKTLGPTSYLEPGQVLPTPGEVAMRAFVLGPPRNRERLFKDKPSTNPDTQETYFDTLMIDGKRMESYAEGEDKDATALSPFSPRYCQIRSDGAHGFTDPPRGQEIAQAWIREWLRDSYLGEADATGPEADALARRRIDMDWLGAASTLALKLDSDTNNTSLALAFEIPDGDGQAILLFAADAQVGNWLSWHDQSYTDETGRTVTAENLLNRTRFYKVGHHGSHNATLDKLGLAMMIRDDLVAAIPTDEDLGNRQGVKGWQMPNPRVNAALRTRTRGRILRNDRLYWPDDAAKRATDADLAGVDPAFFQRITEHELYLEYKLLPKEIA